MAAAPAVADDTQPDAIGSALWTMEGHRRSWNTHPPEQIDSLPSAGSPQQRQLSSVSGRLTISAGVAPSLRAPSPQGSD